MRVRRSTVVALAVGAVVLVVLVWLTRPSGQGTPLDPRGTGPTGTAAMLELVERLGADVTIAAEPPVEAGPQTLVVLVDRFDDQARQRIEARVRDGDRLVLFDPASPLNPVPVTEQLFTDTFGVLGREPSCPLLDGVADRVESARWSVLDPGDDATAACYPVGDGVGLVVRPSGDGEVAVTGAVDALVNRTVADAAHARLAAALLAPQGGGEVVVLWDVEVGGDTALLDLLPVGVTRAFWVLLAAAALYAVARARRLGPPVAEGLDVRVPASELVLAIGDLLGRHGHREAAAARLRDDLRHEVVRALHVPRDTPPELLVELLSARLDDDLDTDGLRRALLDGPVPDDDALVAVTAALARVRATVRRPGAAGATSSRE